METQRRDWRRLLALAYAQPTGRHNERVVYAGSTRGKKQQSLPGPLYDAVCVTLFLVLGIGLLF